MHDSSGPSGPDVTRSSTPTLLLDSAGRITTASPGACTLTGFVREEILSRTLEEVLPLIRPMDLVSMLGTLPEEGELRLMTELGHKDGTRRRVRLRVSRGPKRQGILVRLRHDRRAEDHLTEEADFGRAILAECEGPVLVLNGEDRIVLASRGCEVLLGLSASHLRGRRPWDFFHPTGNCEGGREAILRLRATGNPECQSWTWRGSGGEPVFLDFRLSLFRGSESDRTYVILFGALWAGPDRDIDQSRPEEHGVRSALERVRTILDSVPSLISYIDRDRRVVFVNRCYQDWFGLEVARVEGSYVQDVIPGDLLNVLSPHLEKALAGEKDLFEYEVPVTGKSSRWRQAIYLPDVDPEGKVRGIFIQVHDITDHRRLVSELLNRQAGLERAVREREGAEREIRKLNESLECRARDRTRDLEKALGDLRTFGYSIAHNLRAPLRAMAGMGQVLRDDYSDRPLDAGGRDIAGRMEGAARRMDDMIQGLLDFGRVAAGELDLGPVSLREALARALATLGPELDRRSVQIEAPGVYPEVLADAGVLNLVLVHLLSNALKFVAPGTEPRIVLSVDLQGTTARLLIQDNGIGIAPEHRDRVFQLFEQLKPEEYPGTGIGLSIAKKAVERLGGRLDFESAPGQGSRFWIELPRP